MTFRALAREAALTGIAMGAMAGGLAGAVTFWVFVWHYFGKATGWW